MSANKLKYKYFKRESSSSSTTQERVCNCLFSQNKIQKPHTQFTPPWWWKEEPSWKPQNSFHHSLQGIPLDRACVRLLLQQQPTAAMYIPLSTTTTYVCKAVCNSEFSLPPPPPNKGCCNNNKAVCGHPTYHSWRENTRVRPRCDREWASRPKSSHTGIHLMLPVTPRGQSEYLVVGLSSYLMQSVWCHVKSSKLGKKVALIDDQSGLGGTCVNTGTIPSKTLREGTKKGEQRIITVCFYCLIVNGFLQ